MDVIDLGCAVLRMPFFEWFMAVAGYFGHSAVGSGVGLLLLAHGYAYHNERSKGAGIAVLVALIAAGVAAQILKEVFQWPRPSLRSSQGFPSGHTSGAFALASALTAWWPGLGPLFYLFALLTAISRVYFRAHFTWDLLGGMVVGLLAGIPAARKFIAHAPRAGFAPLRLAAWAGVAAFSAVSLTLLFFMDASIGRYRIFPEVAKHAPAIATLDFGTPQARDSLRYGWSDDERWLDGKQSVVWANGLASELTMNLPSVQDYRFRFYVFPYPPKGPACQTVEVRINATLASKMRLEPGWHSYEFDVPSTAVRAGNNSIQLFYNYAESPKSRNRSSDERALSVAFDKFDVFPVR